MAIVIARPEHLEPEVLPTATGADRAESHAPDQHDPGRIRAPDDVEPERAPDHKAQERGRDQERREAEAACGASQFFVYT
jgi:hypothetical protein